jgi:hypothetical protein
VVKANEKQADDESSDIHIECKDTQFLPQSPPKWGEKYAICYNSTHLGGGLSKENA